MNEPHDVPATQWLASANAAIAAIRETGATNLVLVPGTIWTGAHSWEEERDGGANGLILDLYRSGRGRALNLLHLAYHYGINPVAFYYLHRENAGGGAGPVEAMIAEVTNTPWGETRCYVLGVDSEAEGELSGDFDKQLHVSPFMPMEQRYEWSATDPGERLAISIANHDPAGRRVFEASLALRRREITPGALRAMLFRYPPMTISTIARIYLNALKLKAKGAPYFSPPEDAPSR